MTDFAMIRGDTKTLAVTLTDVNGDALNLTDKELTFTAARFGSDDIVKTEGDGITVTSAMDGECTVTIEPADTENVSFPNEFGWGGYRGSFEYRWDFEVVDDSTGEVRTPLRGRLKVYPDVTRNTA